MKVFIVSLHRVGTQSINAMLQDAGLKAIHWPTEANGVDLQAASVGHEADLEFVADLLVPVTNNFDAISDVPIPALYDVLARRYPEAKFIALSRSPMSWVRSARRHVGERRLDPFEKVQYWRYLPWKPEFLSEVSDHEMVEMFRRHYADVITYFAGSDRLLHAALGAPNVGELICAHLGLPLAELPHTDYLPPIDAPASAPAAGEQFTAAFAKMEQVFDERLAVERAKVAALTEEIDRVIAERDAAHHRTMETQAAHDALLSAERATIAALTHELVESRLQGEATIVEIREQLVSEAASFAAEREAMLGEAALLVAQRDAAVSEGAALAVLRDAALNQTAALGAQCDAALVEVSALTEERSRLVTQNEALRGQIDALIGRIRRA